MALIPTLDFSLFNNGTAGEREEVALALTRSLQVHGFVKLRNHGIVLNEARAFQQWSMKFFSMPRDQRNAIENLAGPHPQRGYSMVGVEQTAKLRSENFGGGNGDGLLDEREHFDAGPSDDMLYPNKWPSEEALPGFRVFMEEGYSHLQAMALNIMSALEIGLGLAPGTLVERCQPAASELRLNHYPPLQKSVLERGFIRRTWPHTDLGIITLLFQDEIGGLEVEDRTATKNKSRIFVPVAPGATDDIVVNVSDTFQRWTNGVMRAALHQVGLPSNIGSLASTAEELMPRRFSTVFFLKADRDTSVGPLPEFVTATRPAEYDEMTALEYQQRSTDILHQASYNTAVRV